MLISVIIPVYNAENCLQKCLNSIQEQSFHDFEVIIVDDGSKDNSIKIASDIAIADSRFSVVQQKNAGPSTARNCGILNAQGDFICFIDADDYVDRNYLKYFVDNQMDSETLLIQDVFKVQNGTTEPNCRYANEVVDISEFEKLIIKNKLLSYGYPFAKFFRRDIIVSNSILFNKNIHFSEDLLFLLNYLQYCKRIFFLSQPHYYYIKNGVGLSNKYHSYESEMECYQEYIKVINVVFDYNALNKITKNKIDAGAGHFLTRAINSFYRPATSQSRDSRIQKIKMLNDKTAKINYKAWNSFYLRKLDVFLFYHGFISLFDFYKKIAFGLRYKLDKYWKMYQKI